MRKAIKAVSAFMALICTFVFAFICYGTAYVPDSIIAQDTYSADTGNPFFNCVCEGGTAVSAGSLSKVYPAQIKLFNVVPVKNSTVRVVCNFTITESREARNTICNFIQSRVDNFGRNRGIGIYGNSLHGVTSLVGTSVPLLILVYHMKMKLSI